MDGGKKEIIKALQLQRHKYELAIKNRTIVLAMHPDTLNFNFLS